MDEPDPRTSRPILLVGMPGSGKSTIGRLLADRLGLAVHDTDATIAARLGLPIAEIFARHGEPRFRAEEKRELATLLNGAPGVIAAGGGAFIEAGNRMLTLESAHVLWLDADLTTLEKRLDGASNRPLLAERGALARLKAERDPVYALAPVRIDSAPPPEAVVAAIMAALAEPAR